MITKDCTCDANRFSGGFRSPSEYITLTTWIAQNSHFQQTPVLTPYDTVGSKEKWYSCALCHQVWRLVDPDPPFTGVWERVTD